MKHSPVIADVEGGAIDSVPDCSATASGSSQRQESAINGNTNGCGVLSANQEPRCNPQRMLIVFLLVVQNCAAVLMLRFTRTREHVVMYSITALVLAQEVLKLTISSLWLLHDVWSHVSSAEKKEEEQQAACSSLATPTAINSASSGRRNTTPIAFMRLVWQQLCAETFSGETTRMVLPAVLFTLQNALLVVALENLDATLFQLIYQAKTCVTALFMVVMLGRTFSTKKWFCMIVLVAGVVLVQIKPDTGRAKSQRGESMFLGVLCVALCACSSAFAGVYMEKVFKDKKSTLLSARNVHLSGFSVIACAVTMVYSFLVSLRSGPLTADVSNRPGTALRPQSGPVGLGESIEHFFVGFDLLVWLMVANQAAGGLLVALLIKYADNIMKSIATALAIIASGIVSYFLLGVGVPNVAFLCGGTLVVGAAVCYSFVD